MQATTSGEYSTEELSSVEDGIWESFVRSHPCSTVFHTLEWKRAIQNSFDYSIDYQIVRNSGGDVVAVIPLFRTPEITGASRTNPFCEYGYPLVAEGANLLEVLDKLADKTGSLESLLIKESVLSGNRGYYQSGFGGVRTGVGFYLSTATSYSNIERMSFNRDLRTSIQDAETKELTVNATTNVDEYYDLYHLTMQRLGSPPFPKQFFKELQTQLGDNFDLLVVRDSRPIGGLVSLDHKDRKYVLSNASDQGHWEKHPNELLYARMIERACDSDCVLVDFGRTEPNSSLYRFKKKFGGETAPLITMVYPPHRTGRASVSEYKKLKPLTKKLSPIITNPVVGPKLKGWVHE